jgi:hypothetical protein
MQVKLTENKKLRQDLIKLINTKANEGIIDRNRKVKLIEIAQSAQIQTVINIYDTLLKTEYYTTINQLKKKQISKSREKPRNYDFYKKTIFNYRDVKTGVLGGVISKFINLGKNIKFKNITDISNTSTTRSFNYFNMNTKAGAERFLKVIKYDEYFINNIEDAHKSLYLDSSNLNLDFEKEPTIQLKFLQFFDTEEGNENDRNTVNYNVIHDPKGFIDFGRNIDFRRFQNKIENHKENIRTNSRTKPYFIGYRILYNFKNINIDNTNLINNLKAFSPSNDREYHKYTIAGTSTEKICIYESFIIINDMLEKRKSNGIEIKNKNITGKRTALLNEMLNKEDDEIITNVKEGNLIPSIKLLNIKYNKRSFITFYNDLVSDIIFIDEQGIIKNIKIEDSYKYKINKVFLYDSNKFHIAPSDFKNYNEMLENLKSKKENKSISKIENTKLNVINNDIKNSKKAIYSMKPSILKVNQDVEEILNNCLRFDYETFSNENGEQIPFLLCIEGKIKAEYKIKSFYGLNCTLQGLEWLKPYTELLNYSSTKPNKKTNYIHMYSFNGSKFDNLFLFKELYKLDKNTEFLFSNNSIKSIRYNNFKIFDLNLYYTGTSLRKIASKLTTNKLDKKGIYPYKFINKDTIHFKGEFPKREFFNNDDFNENDTYEKLREENNNYIDIEEYTIKYCLMDCKLTGILAEHHIKNSIGMINDKYYNVIDKSTGAGVALTMFKQVFLKDDLYGSPEKILRKEEIAYIGGRVEVFKKSFKSKNENDRLFYNDINSSYPFSMTQEMPFKFLKTINKEFKAELNNIKPYNLYGVSKYEYKGTNKQFINNLIEKSEFGNISINTNHNNNYKWGCEIIEAINNNIDIEIYEINEYEPKAIFKEYSEYFYNERLKIKNTNKGLGEFYKLLLNSLYGKFGSRVFNETKLINSFDDIFKISDGNLKMILNYNMLDENIGIMEYKKAGQEIASIHNLIRFSSYITALSRCNLSIVMRDIGHNEIYYIDTDSIFSSKKPSLNFIDNNILGKWKEEEPNGIHTAYFLCKKTYAYKTFEDETTIKAKGMNKSNLLFENYEDLHNRTIEDIKISSVQFKRTLNNIIVDNDAIRTLKPIYNKRKWVENESYAFENLSELEEYNNEFLSNT